MYRGLGVKLPQWNWPFSIKLYPTSDARKIYTDMSPIMTFCNSERGEWDAIFFKALDHQRRHHLDSNQPLQTRNPHLPPPPHRRDWWEDFPGRPQKPPHILSAAVHSLYNQPGIHIFIFFHICCLRILLLYPLSPQPTLLQEQCWWSYGKGICIRWTGQLEIASG